MSGTVSYNRRGGGRRDDGPRRDCRYCPTDSRRHRYSSFSIMKWFRRTSRRADESTWFRDDLQRIQQAYADFQEPDYAAVTPIGRRRRWPAAAATWSRWSGSTTTVYSFAYTGGGERDERSAAGGGDDVVEYIDAAATLPAPRRRADGGAPQFCSLTTTARRRNKRLAPPPPPPQTPTTGTAVAGSSSSSSAATTAKTTTTSRKKYRAPQPPAAAAPAVAPSVLRSRTGVATVRRGRKKGPAPKPPVQPRPREPEIGGVVRRKITQYERDRLLERVDKIEKHFFPVSKNRNRNEKADHDGDEIAAAAAAAAVRGEHVKTPPEAATATPSRNSRDNGFASVAALYTAMAATNLTELDKRAAEICRRKRLEKAAAAADANKVAPAAVRPQPNAITDEHKNAIVAAVIRKSYPSTVADGKRSSCDKAVIVAAAAAAAADDDDKRLVRHKRLEFFQKQNGSTMLSLGTQTIDGTDVIVPPKTRSISTNTGRKIQSVAAKSGGGCSSPSVNVLIQRWDRLLSKTKIFSADQQQTPAGNSTDDASPLSTDLAQKLHKEIEEEKKSKKLPEKNQLNSKLKYFKAPIIKPPNTINSNIAWRSKFATSVKNMNASNSNKNNDLESVKAEIKQLNDKLNTVVAELANEKSYNTMLMNSYTSVFDKCQELENQKIAHNVYEEKLEEKNKELESVLSENNDLLQQLNELEIALENANKNNDILVEEYKHIVADLAEKVKELEEERYGWNEYQIKLENQISENQNALDRKVEYINNQCLIIDNLKQEKQALKGQVKQRQSNESDNYENQISKLSSIIADLKSKLVITEESYNREMMDMKNMLSDKDKQIMKKSECINQQNIALALMREITSGTNDNPKYR